MVIWNPSPNATTFDLLRGTISALPVGPGAGDETCLGNNVVVSAYTDAAVPPADSGYWYLIRGTNACAGNGPYGFAGVRGAPGTPRASTTCP